MTVFNPITLIDAYKLDHRRQYPVGTTRVYSNLTPRTSRIEGVTEVTLFGLQAFLQRFLIDDMAPFFAASEQEVRDRYDARSTSVVGPNSIGTDHIVALHRLGHVPLRFCAIPEGDAVPLRFPMITVENTHPDFAWLVNYIETIMSAALWQPCTSATQAVHLRRLLDTAARATGGDPAFVDWQGHDFSMRGMAGVEAAAASGAGHLLAFAGTDTIPAMDWVDHYYPHRADLLVGGSVAATEHSVMCAGGADDELETFGRLLDLYPAGIVSVVSDTWDLWAVCTEILPKLRQRIMERDGKLVVRPDSGDPVDIICGDPAAPEGTPANLGVAEQLWATFGGTVNDAGYRVLDPHIGMIYGDSINYDRAREMTQRLAERGFASTNIVLGVGSFTYQFVTRDTFGFAMKATWAEVYGKGRDLFKAPKTDSGVKKSAAGRLAVVRDDGDTLQLIERATETDEARSILTRVWEDGRFVRFDSYDTILDRVGLRVLR
jgi:nicotinamide phosphoribosyltransferase